MVDMQDRMFSAFLIGDTPTFTVMIRMLMSTDISYDSTNDCKVSASLIPCCHILADMTSHLQCRSSKVLSEHDALAS